MATDELFDAYAAEWWGLLSPDVERFLGWLAVLGEQVTRELASPEWTHIRVFLERGWMRSLTLYMALHKVSCLPVTGPCKRRSSLGLREVPVIVIAHLTELQKRAYLIADNQLALNSDWDEEKLGRELEELERQLVDLKVVGFSPEELDRLLADLVPEQLVEEDSVPETPRQAVTIPGELWLLGKHRVLCGDALSSESLDRVLEGRPAAMVFSDPPYNVAHMQKSSGSGGSRPIANDNLGAQFEDFLQAACVELLRVTQGAVYLCMSSSELHAQHRAFTAAGGHWSTFVIWSKDRFTIGQGAVKEGE
jgi:hypothetical protein